MTTPQPFSRFWAASGITAQAAILLAAVSGAIYIATFAPLELDEPPRLLYLPHLAVMMLFFACFVRTFMRLFDSKRRSINVFAVKMPRSIAIAAVVALICFVMSLGHLVVTGEPVRGVVSLRVLSSAWA